MSPSRGPPGVRRVTGSDMARTFDASAPDFDARFDALLKERRGGGDSVDAAAGAVIEQVRAGGVQALLDLTRKFDKIDLTEADLRVTAEEVEAGAAACSQEVRDAIAFAAKRIRAYHERQRPADAAWIDEAGVSLGWRWTPLDSVGVYVPADVRLILPQ